MKLLIKFYSSSFCSIIKAEELEIKSNKILVRQLKEQISTKFHLPISELILTIKYENKGKNKLCNLITLSDEFPLYYFFIQNNSEIFLEHYIVADKNREIFEKIKNSKGKKLKYLKKLQIFSENQNNTKKNKNLPMIKESDNEYTEIESKNNEESKNNIIKQAIQFIIEDKTVPFKEYIYINDFMQEDMSILATKENGWNALHYSCFYGREEITESLIALFNPSAELINGLTKDGYTPLHLACIKGHINIVRILLFLKEIDVNILQEKDGTPLHIACKKNDMQIVSILVSFKANLNLKNSNNKLPIDLTTDDNIKKIIKKAMIYSSKDEENNSLTSETELSLYVDNFFTPPKPPITIGSLEKRGQFLPIYDNLFIEVNPILGCIKKYKDKTKYPNEHYGIIDLNTVNSCKREFANNKEMFYFSILYSSKEIFRVKNEESFKKWVKVINESTIYCKYWARISKINKNVKEYLSRQKNIIEIIEENGEIKNYEEEQKKKDEEMKEKRREKELISIRQQNNIFNMNSLKVSDKKEKPKAKDTNNKNLCKINFIKKSNLSLNLLDDSSKKGINIKSFEKVELLFHYSYGKVYKVKLKKNLIKEFNIKSEFLILKRIKKKEIYILKQLKYVEDEINLISQCDCPFILKILFSFQDKKYIYMVEEFCPGGNLKWHINSNLFEEEEAKFYIAELILVIEHLHKKGIVYKNLKTEKIFINDKNHIQLIGYGLIKEKKNNKDNKNNEENGSKEDENFFFGIQDEYISPEILALRGEEKMADIYGIGEVLYEMVSGTKPFYSKENADLFKNDIYKNKNKLMLNDYFSMELKNLLMKLLCRDPENRIGVNDIGEIKKHQFFKGIDWTKLGKMEIIPPIDLVKNKSDNKNSMYFKRKNNKQKDFSLDFHVIKNMEQSPLLKKNETNNTENAQNGNEENKINNNDENQDDENNKNINENVNVIININENYIEGPKKKDEKENNANI